ncbi:lipase family alpha/beta hydrolase [Gordonia hankookensis]|uniref:Alpha/beta fold hydrolase n=1 Tax=Gordonia hankookensis TaxID=589403 RepID=A0ABR7WHZ9_9ACTN|nr:alpha/beta fold hydrolase [Gordonia hankookensis]MBD1322386.1 alpha/beta fold hydrolase [Gordonia hankookensis]
MQRTLTRFGLFGGLAVIATALTTAFGGIASAAPFPVTTDVNQAVATGFTRPATTSPAGSNRFDCRDRSGRDPVILLHGTALNQDANLAYLAPTLANAGYCVFSMTYGLTSWSGNVGGLGDKNRSARQVAALVDRVLAATHARRVDFVGHSQGGAIAQLVSQLPGRAAQIDTIIGLSAPNRGYSRTSNITDRLPAAARQPGENDWGPRHPNIHYLNLATVHDEIVTPWQNSLMTAGPNVTNTRVQDVCPRSEIGHLGMAFSPTVAALVRNGLDPAHRVTVPCGDDYPG